MKLHLRLKLGQNESQPQQPKVYDADLPTSQLLAHRRALFQVEEDRDQLTRSIIHGERRVRRILGAVGDLVRGLRTPPHPER